MKHRIRNRRQHSVKGANSCQNSKNETNCNLLTLTVSGKLSLRAYHFADEAKVELSNCNNGTDGNRHRTTYERAPVSGE
jgi:hypothetical protein